MAVPESDLNAALELFEGLSAPLTHRRMMGGFCLYAGGRLFASLHGDGRIYLRAKGALAERLAQAGARQLVWVRPSDGRDQAMGYWSLPEPALDDAQAACDWAKAALSQED